MSFHVDYDHCQNRPFHTLEGALRAIRTLFPDGAPQSVLDVGCGTGTWLRACLELGSKEVVGLDGSDLPATDLLVAKEIVICADLNRPFDLGRRFDMVLCLETVEHLDPESARTIVGALCAHGDRILFSAAVPGQSGTHHVNCRWPSYWQQLFNVFGYACDDAVRWAIWDDAAIEPWYRQNLMIAARDEKRAGAEPRISSVLHPDILPYMAPALLAQNKSAIEAGSLPSSWYVKTPIKAAAAKLRRLARRHNASGAK